MLKEALARCDRQHTATSQTYAAETFGSTCPCHKRAGSQTDLTWLSFSCRRSATDFHRWPSSIDMQSCIAAGLAPPTKTSSVSSALASPRSIALASRPLPASASASGCVGGECSDFRFRGGGSEDPWPAAWARLTRCDSRSPAARSSAADGWSTQKTLSNLTPTKTSRWGSLGRYLRHHGRQKKSLDSLVLGGAIGAEAAFKKRDAHHLGRLSINARGADKKLSTGPTPCVCV